MKITAHMLATRLGTVARDLGRPLDEIQLAAAIDGQRLELAKDNFRVDDDGTLLLTISAGPTRAEQAEENELRTLQIVDLAAATVTEAFAEKHWNGAMRDLIDELLDDGGQQHPSFGPILEVMQRPSEFERFTEQDQLADNAHALFRRQLLGLAIQFGSTVRKYLGKDTYASGFGYMRTVWIYADTYEAAWELAVQWAEKSHDQDAARDAE